LCLTEADISYICSNDHKRGKILYLSNANYPAPIRGGNHRCQCVVKNGFSRGLDLHAIDVLITLSSYRQKHCAQKLVIQDSYGYNRAVTCGHEGLYGFRTIYDRGVTNVTLTLESTSHESRSYIWLQVKGQCPLVMHQRHADPREHLATGQRSVVAIHY
jgi:hypothetical protein